MNLKLGQIVYHEGMYNGQKILEVVGLRKNFVELYDNTYGTANWMNIEGVILYPNTEYEINEAFRELADLIVSRHQSIFLNLDMSDKNKRIILSKLNYSSDMLGGY